MAPFKALDTLSLYTQPQATWDWSPSSQLKVGDGNHLVVSTLGMQVNLFGLWIVFAGAPYAYRDINHR